MKGRVDLDKVSMSIKKETEALLRKVLEGFDAEGQEYPYAVDVKITLTMGTGDVAVNIKAVDRHLLQ